MGQVQRGTILLQLALVCCRWVLEIDSPLRVLTSLNLLSIAGLRDSRYVNVFPHGPANTVQEVVVIDITRWEQLSEEETTESRFTVYHLLGRWSAHVKDPSSIDVPKSSLELHSTGRSPYSLSPGHRLH